MLVATTASVTAAIAAIIIFTSAATACIFRLCQHNDADKTNCHNAK